MRGCNVAAGNAKHRMVLGACKCGLRRCDIPMRSKWRHKKAAKLCDICRRVIHLPCMSWHLERVTLTRAGPFRLQETMEGAQYRHGVQLSTEDTFMGALECADKASPA